MGVCQIGRQDQAREYDLVNGVKLRSNRKQIANLARLTAESPNDQLLSDLRALEKKMGLVLTLVSLRLSC